jgi:hypothetical protein
MICIVACVTNSVTSASYPKPPLLLRPTPQPSTAQGSSALALGPRSLERIEAKQLILLARPERFERPTLRFVV